MGLVILIAQSKIVPITSIFQHIYSHNVFLLTPAPFSTIFFGYPHPKFKFPPPLSPAHLTPPPHIFLQKPPPPPPLINYENHTLTSDFVDLLHSHSFISLINRPTRITSTTATLIDNIFTNSTNIENSFQGLLVTDVSDHLPIFCVDLEKSDCVKEDFIYRRNMSQRSKLAFRDDLANLDWNEMYHISDTQAAFGWFHSKLLLLCNKHFPKQKVKLKYNTRKMWLTQDATKNKGCHKK